MRSLPGSGDIDDRSAKRLAARAQAGRSPSRGSRRHVGQHYPSAFHYGSAARRRRTLLSEGHRGSSHCASLIVSYIGHRSSTQVATGFDRAEHGSVIVPTGRALPEVGSVGQGDARLLPDLELPVLRLLALALVVLHGDRTFTMRRRTQRVPTVRPEVEGGRVRHDLATLRPSAHLIPTPTPRPEPGRSDRVRTRQGA